MLTCKQVSNALARGDYKDLHPIRRFFLKLHVLICPICGKFNRQIIKTQDMCREFKQHEESLPTDRPKMDDQKKSELQELLAAQSAQIQEEDAKRAS